MTNIIGASRIFLSDPKKNLSRIIPYTAGHLKITYRLVAEALGSSKYSKPYPQHQELLDLVDFNEGFFIVCGANDGYMVDPTYFLERFRGWRGILIEPLPKAAAACRKNRPKSIVVEAALVSKTHNAPTITIIDCNAMSVTANTSFDITQWTKDGEKAQGIQAVPRQVTALTLDTVIEKYCPATPIDLLVLDVEGSEESVLSGFSIEKNAPRYILIEIHTEEMYSRINTQISHSYSLVKKIGTHDYIFIHKNETSR